MKFEEVLNIVEEDNSDDILNDPFIIKYIQEHSFIDFIKKSNDFGLVTTFNRNFVLDRAAVNMANFIAAQKRFGSSASTITEDINTWIITTLSLRAKNGKIKKFGIDFKDENNSLDKNIEAAFELFKNTHKNDKDLEAEIAAFNKKKITSAITKINRNKNKNKHYDPKEKRYMYNNDKFYFTEKERNEYNNLSTQDWRRWEIICSKATGIPCTQKGTPLVDLKNTNTNIQCKFSKSGGQITYSNIRTILNEGNKNISLMLCCKGKYAYISTDKDLKDSLFSDYKNYLISDIESQMNIRHMVTANDEKRKIYERLKLKKFREKLKEDKEACKSVIKISFKNRSNYFDFYVTATASRLYKIYGGDKKYLEEIKKIISVNNLNFKIN